MPTLKLILSVALPAKKNEQCCAFNLCSRKLEVACREQALPLFQLLTARFDTRRFSINPQAISDGKSVLVTHSLGSSRGLKPPLDEEFLTSLRDWLGLRIIQSRNFLVKDIEVGAEKFFDHLEFGDGVSSCKLFHAGSKPIVEFA